MSRLFDLKSTQRQQPSSDEARKVMRDALAAAELDDNARKLGELLGASQAVTPVKYTRERRGRWLVEHGRAGDDYLYQLHPLKTPTGSWQDIVTGFIAAIDSIFPPSLHKYYKLPDERWQIHFFTIQLEKVCRLPGWERAAEKAVDALASVDAWTSAPRARADHSPPTGKRDSDEGTR